MADGSGRRRLGDISRAVNNLDRNPTRLLFGPSNCDGAGAAAANGAGQGCSGSARRTAGVATPAAVTKPPAKLTAAVCRRKSVITPSLPGVDPPDGAEGLRCGRMARQCIVLTSCALRTRCDPRVKPTDDVRLVSDVVALKTSALGPVCRQPIAVSAAISSIPRRGRPGMLHRITRRGLRNRRVARCSRCDVAKSESTRAVDTDPVAADIIRAAPTCGAVNAVS